MPITRGQRRSFEPCGMIVSADLGRSHPNKRCTMVCAGRTVWGVAQRGDRDLPAPSDGARPPASADVGWIRANWAAKPVTPWRAYSERA